MINLVTIQDLSAGGRHQECLQACQQILQSEPENSLPWKYAGKSLLSLRQFEKAQQCLLKAHQLDGSDPEIVKDIGNLFLNIGNKDTAVGWYKKALEINNNYAPAINNLANIKRQSGNTLEAVELYKRVIQADPKLIQGYVGAAASFLELGDLDQAESFAAQALAINERTPGVNEICGIVLQNKNKSNEAIKCYQKELEVNPQASNSLLNLGLLHLQKGQTATGVESLSKASAIAPSEQCSLLLAQAYQNFGQLQAAIIEYKKLNINQSKNKMIPFNLGLCLLNTGNNIDAIEAFKTAIQLDDSFIPAWGNLGNSLKREGRLKEAIQATQKVLDLDPDNPTAHMNLGGIYKELGQLDQALASTLQSLELKTDNPDALINLGGIYKDLGQLDQALASTLQSLELKPDNPTAHMNLGGIYKDLGQLDQALTSTLQSLELKPDNPTAHMNLGSIHKELGQFDQALASTLQSLELKTDNPDALINLGGIYKELGQFDQALASTLQSLELKPDNPTAHMNLGGIQKELGQLDQALASTLQSLELKPDNPTAHMNLGGIYKELGQFDQALASTLQSLELKTDNPDALINLGGIYKELGQLDQALASTLQSLKLKPDNPTAHMNLGGIYQAMGAIKKSSESLQKALAMNPHLPEALYMSSMTLEDVNTAHSLLQKIEEVDQTALPLRDKSKIEFAKSNCLHKEKDYENASDVLQKANELKLLFMPSNATTLIKHIQAIQNTLTANKISTSGQRCDQIFIVGVPRSGSTLLSAILNTNPLTKDLGESSALPKAIRALLSQNTSSKRQSLGHFYANFINEVMAQDIITVDKQLYNFMHCHYMANHMPGAKIIHATRNPLDNILSMLRANLIAGNNFTASAEDSAKFIIEQEKLMRTFKKLFPHKIYTYSYDKLVNDPQAETRTLLAWLGIEWSESYLDFHKNKQVINTASMMQARQPISNKSVGGWKNYALLLKPARQLLLDSNLFTEESLC